MLELNRDTLRTQKAALLSAAWLVRKSRNDADVEILLSIVALLEELQSSATTRTKP